MLAPLPAGLLDGGAPRVLVALHACGELHCELLRAAHRAAARRAPGRSLDWQLCVAPCCFDKQRASVYTPLSRRAHFLLLDISERADGERRGSRVDLKVA